MPKKEKKIQKRFTNEKKYGIIIPQKEKRGGRMDYIDRIKQLKSEKRMTNDELAALTGIPLGTLSKILAGFSDSPKLSNIVAICNVLGCTLDYAVMGIPENNNNYTLEAGEMRFIENYRKLDEHGREMVTLVLEKECERLRTESYASKSDLPSNKKILSMPSDMLAKKRIDSSVGLGKRAILLYGMSVSAGTGVFLDDSVAEEIYIPDNSKTEDADFAVKISGHSMEPKYHDGDVLLVRDCDSIENGELGIFVLDGAGYFKIYGGDRLLSLNPEFGEIPLRDFNEVSCCGKVIGKLKRK